MGLSKYQRKQIVFARTASAQNKPKAPEPKLPPQPQSTFRPPPQPEKPRLADQPLPAITLNPAEREMATALAKCNTLLDQGDPRWVTFKLGPPVRP